MQGESVDPPLPLSLRLLVRQPAAAAEYEPVPGGEVEGGQSEDEDDGDEDDKE